jgi:hypothetical protein
MFGILAGTIGLCGSLIYLMEKQERLYFQECSINDKNANINKEYIKLTEEKTKIKFMIKEIYSYKLKEVDKLKEICDECNKYQNKWSDNNEIYDTPPSRLFIQRYDIKRTKCSIHGDVIGNFINNIIPDSSKKTDEYKYYTFEKDILN